MSEILVQGVRYFLLGETLAQSVRNWSSEPESGTGTAQLDFGQISGEIDKRVI